MGRRRPLAAGAVALAVAAASVTAWWLVDGRPSPSGRGAGLERVAPTTAAPGVDVGERPRGGSVRVGVWAAPDVSAPTLGGAAVRALVLPQLFLAAPDGRWQAWLVEPGSDRTAPDLESASFRLRPGAVWSDGTPVTVDDLRRSADLRFVAGVDGPAPDDGRVTVRFTQPLPGWRRLWSGADSVSAPAPGVWGGPFVVASAVPGLETVLRRNDRWWGAPAPFLDEVRLVLVPDYTIALQLFERGELDVLAPLAATVRQGDLARVPGTRVEVAEDGGWWAGLLANPDELDEADRRAVLATVDRAAFVGTLLRGEARVLDGFDGPGDRTWAGAAPGDEAALRSLQGETVDVVGLVEEPNTSLLERSMQKRARQADAQLELRNAEADRVEPWVAAGEYDAAVVVTWDPPDVCWRCRWESVDGGLARAADAGEPGAARRLEERLRDDAVVLPLWRPVTAVGVRDGVGGVRANGWGLSAAWDAWEWFRTG